MQQGSLVLMKQQRSVALICKQSFILRFSRFSLSPLSIRQQADTGSVQPVDIVEHLAAKESDITETEVNADVAP